MAYVGTWTDTDNGIIYAWNSTDETNKRARVIGRDPDPIYSSTDIIIRDTIEVNGVTWEVWFVGDFSDDTIIISMILPKFIKKLGTSAFNNAAIQQVNFSQATLLNGVNSSCFANSKIKSIDMTNCPSLKIIGGYTFGSCSELIKVIMPHVTTLHETAFSGAVPVEELNLNSMTTMNFAMFSGIIGSSLKILSLNSVTALPPDIFNYFTLLEDLSLNSVTALPPEIFRSFTSLKTISLQMATAIPHSVFLDCSALTTVDLSMVTSVGYSAFTNCALTTISLPIATTLGNDVFNGCIALTTISLPMATTLGNDVFLNCIALNDLNLNAIPSITATTLDGIGSSLKIISLNSVTNLGLDPDTFSNYPALEELSLNSLTSFNFVTLTGGVPTLKKISLNSIINFG